MDSIFNKYKSFELLQIKHDSLRIKYNLVSIDLEKYKIKSKLFENKSITLGELNNIIQERYDNQTEKHETQILYYKEKAKGKFKSFLLGTGLGAIIMAIISLL